MSDQREISPRPKTCERRAPPCLWCWYGFRGGASMLGVELVILLDVRRKPDARRGPMCLLPVRSPFLVRQVPLIGSAFARSSAPNPRIPQGTLARPAHPHGVGSKDRILGRVFCSNANPSRYSTAHRVGTVIIAQQSNGISFNQASITARTGSIQNRQHDNPHRCQVARNSLFDWLFRRPHFLGCDAQNRRRLFGFSLQPPRRAVDVFVPRNPALPYEQSENGSTVIAVSRGRPAVLAKTLLNRRFTTVAQRMRSNPHNACRSRRTGPMFAVLKEK